MPQAYGKSHIPLSQLFPNAYFVNYLKIQLPTFFNQKNIAMFKGSNTPETITYPDLLYRGDSADLYGNVGTNHVLSYWPPFERSSVCICIHHPRCLLRALARATLAEKVYTLPNTVIRLT